MTPIILVKDHPDYKNITEEFLISLINDRYTGRKSKLFFKKSLKFYIDVKNKDVSSLSDKQKNWLWEISCIINDRKSNTTEESFIKVEIPVENINSSAQSSKKSLIQKVIFAIKSLLK